MDEGAAANQPWESVDVVSCEDEEDTAVSSDEEEISTNLPATAPSTSHSCDERHREATTGSSAPKGKHSDYWNEVDDMFTRLVSSVPTAIQKHPAVVPAAQIEYAAHSGDIA